ncbi:hypothetical protein EDD21DRAFT_349155 [Dissophora ornata]|nr:hypothetical protein EDD21DRAFT_349155 [Dissophora ornata]
MVFEFISPSNTTLSRTLEFASLLLENAHNTNDSKIALKSCEDAKKHLDKVYTWGVKDQSVRHKFSEAYFELGKMYQSLERRSKADASFDSGRVENQCYVVSSADV